MRRMFCFSIMEPHILLGFTDMVVDTFILMASKSLEELMELTIVSSCGFLVVTKIPPSRWMSLDLSLGSVAQGRF